MTDVVIRSLRGSARARLKCGEYVQRLAAFENLLAVLSPAALTVYERDPSGTHYAVKARLLEPAACDALLVASAHLVLCHGKRVQCFDFGGVQCAPRLGM